MKKSQILSIFVVLASLSGFSSGFALYEPTAAGTAYGGALLGRGIDGSANSINPATLDDIGECIVQAGFVTEHPRARIKIAKEGVMHKARPLDPGFFVLPHFQVVAPAMWGFTFGLGVSPEYGLGTHFTHDSLMTWSSRETTIKGYVINPNLAYRITDDWSVGLGARVLFLDFEQYSYPAAYMAPMTETAVGVKNHLRGNNGMCDAGFQIGTRYKLLENLSVGAVYKSKIDVRVKGHSYVRNPRGFALADASSGAADANFDLPQSVVLGANWDITDTWHLGTVVSWTEWSSIEKLTFHLPKAQGDKTTKLGWKDTWRVGVAPSWDFAENWTAVISYVYDSNTCPTDQCSTMLPPGDRQLISGGLMWRITENLEADLSYGLVVMGCKSMHMKDGLGQRYRLECHRGLSHAAGFTVTYRF